MSNNERTLRSFMKILLGGKMLTEGDRSEILRDCMSLPPDHRQFLELFLRTEFPDVLSLHEQLERLGNPAIDPRQLRERLKNRLGNSLNATEDEFDTVGLEAAWLEQHFPTGQVSPVIVGGRLVLGELAQHLPQAPRSPASAAAVGSLYGFFGNPRRATAQAFKQLSWLESRCRPYGRSRITELGNKLKTACGAPLPIAAALAIVVALLTGLLINRALANTSSSKVVPGATATVVPPKTLSVVEAFQEALALPEVQKRLKPAGEQPVYLIVLTETNTAAIEDLLVRLPDVHVIGKSSIPLRGTLPTSAEWFDVRDIAELIKAPIPENARLLAVGSGPIGGVDDRDRITVCDVRARELVVSIQGSAGPTNGASAAEYQSLAERSVALDKAVNARVDLYLRMAYASARSDAELAQVRYGEGKLRSLSGVETDRPIARKRFEEALPHLNDTTQRAFAEGYLKQPQ